MKRSTKLWSFSVMIFLLIFSLAACAGGGDSSSAGAGNGEKKDDQKTVEGGDLVLAVLSDASTLDPANATDVPSNNLLINIYDTLLNRDEENNIIEGLATEWEPIDDTTYELTLRDDVVFHDGEAFNAEVVKMNIDRILDEKIGSPRYYLYEMIDKVEVIDEYKVRITTEYPFAPIFSRFTLASLGMISPKAIEEDYKAMENGEEPGSYISNNPIGTGKFKFEDWKPGNEIKLVKNEDYWTDPVHVDSVTFKVIPESTTRIADLERGFVHMADPVEPIEVESINNGDYGFVLQQPSASLSYVGFNTEKEPFNDVRVRQALSMMIDREEVIDGVYEGFGIAAVGPLAPSIPGFNKDSKPITGTVEEAKELLKEAGYEDGFDMELWTNDNPQRVDIAIILQNSLKELNINVKVEQMEFGAYLDKTSEGKHDAFILGWSNSSGDADNTFYPLFHSEQKGSPGNRTFYDNPKVDELLEDARREADPDKRNEIYDEVSQILIEDAPMLFLLYTEFLVGVSNQITGLEVDEGGYYLLENVQFVEE